MKYELIANSNQGVIVDATPVMRDIKDTFKISFVLPDGGAYVALLRGEDNVEYKAVVSDGKIIIPSALLAKDQRVTLTVAKTDGDTILRSWSCHPMKVGSFLQMRKKQKHIEPGLSDEELYERLAEVEKQHAETLAEFETLQKRVNELESAVATKAETSELNKVKELANALYNFAKEAVKEIPYINDYKFSEDLNNED